jgi:hypothetical protein
METDVTETIWGFQNSGPIRAANFRSSVYLTLVLVYFVLGFIPRFSFPPLAAWAISGLWVGQVGPTMPPSPDRCSEVIWEFYLAGGQPCALNSLAF